MAVMKKTEINALESAQSVSLKIKELELALLGLRSEGKIDHVKPMRKAIAKLKTKLHALNTTKVKSSKVN